MISGETLEDQFDRLCECEDAQSRGYELERLVAKLFRAAHFDVQHDSDSARPRQTDLAVNGHGSAYLVEVRWRGRRADTGIVDALHSRLRRTPPAVAGILISVAGFSAEAIEEIENQRSSRTVIPLDEEELSRAFADPHGLVVLLEQKRDSLVMHGSLRFPERPVPEFEDFKASPLHFAIDGGREASILDNAGTHSQFAFAREIPDIDWLSANGVGVTWDLPVRAETEDQVLVVLKELTEIGWAGGYGQWCISQSTRNWYGFGPRSLAEAIGAQGQRLAGLEEVHHTEQLTYVDECPGGFFTLTADLAAHGERVWHVRLSFQLQGAPLNAAPYIRLANSLASGLDTYFRPRDSASVSRLNVDRVPLECVGAVVERDPADEPEDWVVGIVATNPFLDRPGLLADLGLDLGDAVVALGKCGHLVCDLGSWHPAGDPRDYWLRRLELAHTSEATVLRVLADWAEAPGAPGPALPPRS
jgi:hypothetical protein